MSKEIKICSFNTHGIKGNLAYIDYLCRNHEILFLCEHWLHKGEKYIIDAISDDKTTIFDSSMDDCHTTGRPFGGLCWLINQNFKVLKCEFISNFLSIVNIIVNEKELVLIGSYCIYNNNTSEHTTIFENQLNIISSLIDQCRENNDDFILLGDFNADPFRNRYTFDKIFIEFLDVNELTTTIKSKDHHFTYSNDICNSFIDHIIYSKTCSNIQLKNSRIDYNLINTSDHNAITSIVLSNQSPFNCNIISSSIIENKNKKMIINWASSHANEIYNAILEKKLRKIKFKSTFLNHEIDEFKNDLDRLYSEICIACTTSHDETWYILNGNNNKGINRQSWWTNELKELKNMINESSKCIISNPNNENRLQRKIYKKQFRRIQRRNIFMYEQNKAKNIEHLFDINNKEDFWKAFNSFKNYEKVSTLTIDNSNELLSHFKNIFHNDNPDLITNDNQKAIIDQISAFKEECQNSFLSSEKSYVNSKMLDECIVEMKSSNCYRVDGVSSNMIKQGKSDSLILLLKSLINAILCSCHIPYEFNRSKIILISKDKNKKTFDKNNFRPISISNCFAQIFERVILKLSPQLCSTAELQFGFKLGISTYQPLFLVKETMSKYRRSKTPCYVVSLDAEKAFDTVWRKGLFFKLIDKLEKCIWLVLYEYYNLSEGFIWLSENHQSDICSINC